MYLWYIFYIGYLFWGGHNLILKSPLNLKEPSGDKQICSTKSELSRASMWYYWWACRGGPATPPYQPIPAPGQPSLHATNRIDFSWLEYSYSQNVGQLVDLKLLVSLPPHFFFLKFSWNQPFLGRNAIVNGIKTYLLMEKSILKREKSLELVTQNSGEGQVWPGWKQSFTTLWVGKCLVLSGKAFPIGQVPDAERTKQH